MHIWKMATKLDKDIIRESTVQIDGREIMVTVSANQEIKFKLKGMKSGELSIGNLVFKLLRRNGYIEKIMDLKRKSYDKQFK